MLLYYKLYYIQTGEIIAPISHSTLKRHWNTVTMSLPSSS